MEPAQAVDVEDADVAVVDELTGHDAVDTHLAVQDATAPAVLLGPHLRRSRLVIFCYYSQV